MLQLYKARLAIEKLIYKNSINAALAHAERSKTYKAFRKDVQDGIRKQIASIANDQEKIESLILLTKAENPGLVKQVEVFLEDLSIGKMINMNIFLQWAGTQGGQAALDKLGIQGIFNLVNPEVLRFFDAHSNLIIDSVDNTTKNWIAKQIQKGIDEGLGPYEIGKSLVEKGKGISRIRADMIAITETANAMVKVEVEAAMRYGIKSKIWRTSLDDRVDPICIGLEGKEVPINKNFPGGYFGPPAHPICRCFIEEVVPKGWEAPANLWLGA